MVSRPTRPMRAKTRRPGTRAKTERPGAKVSVYRRRRLGYGKPMASNAEKALEVLKKFEGKEEGASDWHVIDQTQINLFGDATLDRQFIHTEPARAARVSPYKVTIAHGFLTLSLIPYLGSSIKPVDTAMYEGLMMGINYGLDKVRFPSPVKVNSRVRTRRELISAELVAPTTIQLKQKVTVEIDGEAKPGCVAETLSRLIYA